MRRKIDKIKALQGAVAVLKQQKAVLEQKLNDAEQELYAAERESKRAKKPTEAMCKILLKMRDGVEIHRRPFHPYGYFLRTARGDYLGDVRDSVFFGLKEREAIDINHANVCRINEHGKSLVPERYNGNEQ